MSFQFAGPFPFWPASPDPTPANAMREYLNRRSQLREQFSARQREQNGVVDRRPAKLCGEAAVHETRRRLR